MNWCSESFNNLSKVTLGWWNQKWKPKHEFYGAGHTAGFGLGGVGMFLGGARTSCREIDRSLRGFLMGIIRKISWGKVSLYMEADAPDFHTLRVEMVTINEVGNLQMIIRTPPQFTLPALSLVPSFLEQQSGQVTCRWVWEVGFTAKFSPTSELVLITFTSQCVSIPQV